MRPFDDGELNIDGLSEDIEGREGLKIVDEEEVWSIFIAAALMWLGARLIRL